MPYPLARAATTIFMLATVLLAGPVASETPNPLQAAPEAAPSTVTTNATMLGRTCPVHGKPWPVCTGDQGSWAFEGGAYCIARSFCPSERSSLPSRPLRKVPVDPKASEGTLKTYAYLASIWGKQTLAGQQDLTWNDSVDMAARVFADTGEYPALMGYDFMNYGKSTGQGRRQTEEAIAHARKGGLVTFTWHWRDPALLGTPRANEAQFYVHEKDARKNTPFMIPVAQGQLDRNSPAFKQLNDGIDLIAVELKRLSDAGVTVLWRPLHEASGHDGAGWFWWGRTRTDGVPPAYAYILLYRHMYDRLVNVHGLHNLIWVANGQHPAWYPGDDVVDIIGYDIYDEADNQRYSSQWPTFRQAQFTPGETKMVALTENSYIPEPDQMKADGAPWLWFMVWNDSGGAVGVSNKSSFWTGEYYNTNAHKRKVYRHPNVITLRDLRLR